MAFSGMTPEQIDTASSQLRKQAQELQSIQSRLTSLINDAMSHWNGTDARNFRAQWYNSYKSKMVSAANHLDSMAAELSQQAAKQREASSSYAADFTGPLLGPLPSPSPAFTPSEDPEPYQGFHFGPPEVPQISTDEGFVYGSKSPTLQDYLDFQVWNAKLEAAKVFRPDLDDATQMYAHYLDNTGTPMEFDLEEGCTEDSAIQTTVDSEIRKAQEAANHFAQTGQTNFSFTGEATTTGAAGYPYPTTEDWQKTIGGFNTWSSADVTVDGNVVTMTVTVHAQDHYNFNPGQSDIATQTPDDENGRFTELGWAKPFDTYGEVTRTVTWTLDDPTHISIVDDTSEPHTGR